MFIEAGPKNRLVPLGVVDEILKPIILENVKAIHGLDIKISIPNVERINKIAEYVRESKFFEQKNELETRDIFNRMKLLLKRANEGIYPLLEKYTEKSEKINKETSDNRYIMTKKDFEKYRAKLSTGSYKKFLLKLPIKNHEVKNSEIENNPEKAEFLHLEDNEYLDYLAGKSLHYILLSLWDLMEYNYRTPEQMFESIDTASEAYFSFFSKYANVKGSGKSANSKNKIRNQVKYLYETLSESEDFASKNDSQIIPILRYEYEKKFNKKLERKDQWFLSIIHATQI